MPYSIFKSGNSYMVKKKSGKVVAGNKTKLSKERAIVYPEKPKSPWGNPELGHPNRQAYTQYPSRKATRARYANE